MVSDYATAKVSAGCLVVPRGVMSGRPISLKSQPKAMLKLKPTRLAGTSKVKKKHNYINHMPNADTDHCVLPVPGCLGRFGVLLGVPCDFSQKP